MNKRFISVLMLLVLMLSCTVFVAADEITEPVTLSVQTTEEFLAFAENCRLDSFSQNLSVSLDADIDLSNTDFSGIPIFCGEFNGNGHTISGVKLQTQGSVIGLFRYLTETANVTNLHISGTITPKGSAATVGGLAGSNAGTISNCTFSGTLAGTDEIGGIAGINTITGSIEECSVSGSISGNHFIGGITGRNSGIIQNCTNTAQINTDHRQNNVDLSDITIDTLTGSESANTVTDIGGIAGSNNGHIRFCKNEANIGYNHIGYNIGGIAGSQIGYLADCENSGIISGRKEIGGIIGQLEPAVSVTYSTDTLQILEGQLDTLSSLAVSISANLNTTSSGIQSQIVMIRGQIESAKNAFSALVPDQEDDNPVPDIQEISSAIDVMTESLSSITESLNNILEYTEDSSWALNRDLQAMLDTIFSMQEVLGHASDNLGGSVSDVSDEDTDEDLTAKLERCVNTGAVNADLNGGGIAGAIAVENDFDPEDDIMLIGDLSLNFAGAYRAVITNCDNTADVTVKKQYAGGIAGLATMGLIRSCTNTGTLNCPDAVYIGGIAGYSDGYIRSCSVKSQIYGKKSVGGISGYAATVTDCLAMVQLLADEEFGCILGNTEDVAQLSKNYYMLLGEDIGAIDGISYESAAQPLSQADFLALENIDDFFRSFTVTFVFDDGTEHAVTLDTGDTLLPGQIPDLPPKEGYVASWSTIENELFFDTVIHAAYRTNRQVIQSTILRDNGLPVLLAEGSFSEGDRLELTAYDNAPVENMIEAWHYTAASTLDTIRYLPPSSVKPEEITVFVCSAEGQWKETVHTVEGSYVVFSPQNSDTGFCIIPAGNGPLPWISVICSVSLMVATILITAIVIARRKKRKVSLDEASSVEG